MTSMHLLSQEQPKNEQCFLWSVGPIVIIAQVEGERLVIARAWLEDDRLSNVRRWSFAGSRSFLGQVTRLVRDVTACETDVEAAVANASRWLAGTGWSRS